MNRSRLLIVLATGAMLTLFTSSAIADESRLVVSVSGQQRLDTFTIEGEGTLMLRSQTSVDAAPGASCFDATGDHLYVGCSKPDSISIFQVKPNGLHQVQSVDVPSKPAYLAITPSGKILIACYYATGQVTVHRITGDGHLSTRPLQTLTLDERAHGVVIDRSGQFVFVPHTRPNSIDQFRMDVATGMLTPNSPPKLQREQGVGPRHLWFHPTADYLYGSNEQGRSVSVYGFDGNTGTLTTLQTLLSMPEDFGGKASTSHIEVHPSGRFVYIANRGHGSLTAFAVDSDSGTLSLLQRNSTQPVVRSFALSPDGQFLVAAGQRSGNLICYRIGTDGRLTQSDAKPAGNALWWVSFSRVHSN